MDNLENNTNDIEVLKKIETLLLSIFIKKSDDFLEYQNQLKANDFILPENKTIYAVMEQLYKNGKTIDLNTITDFMSKNDEFSFKDFEDYLQDVEDEYTTDIKLSEYVEIIKDAAIKRSLDKICQEIINEKWDFSNFDKKITDKIRRFNEIAWDRKTENMISIKKAMEEYDKKFELNNINVVSTGIPTLDSFFPAKGFEKGSLTVLAAGPGVGKTALALNIINNECKKIMNTKDSIKNGKEPTVLFICLEMTSAELIDRLISIISKKPIKELRGSKNPQDEALLNEAKSQIAEYNLHVNSSFKANINDIDSQINTICKSYDVKFVVIDHLHIMDGINEKDEYTKISVITRRLKQIAKDKNIPILLLSQITKDNWEQSSFGKNATQNTLSKKVTLNSLRGSGSIAQDANTVLLMWDAGTSENNKDGKNVVVSVAKQRGGRTGEINLYFTGSTYRFLSIIDNNNQSIENKEKKLD